MGSREISVTVKYKLGHSITDKYEKSDLFCPRCGKQTVFVDTGAGDYYQGPRHVCLECVEAFGCQLYGGDNPSDGETTNTQIVEQIKAKLRLKSRP